LKTTSEVSDASKMYPEEARLDGAPPNSDSRRYAIEPPPLAA
jgi:hypothetical protein